MLKQDHVFDQTKLSQNKRGLIKLRFWKIVSLEKRTRLSLTYSQEKKIKSIHGKNDFVKKNYAQFGPQVNSHESYINW